MLGTRAAASVVLIPLMVGAVFLAEGNPETELQVLDQTLMPDHGGEVQL
jgi:hypothetical protein